MESAGDEVEVSCIQHNLDAHQHDNRILAAESPNQSYSEENDTEAGDPAGLNHRYHQIIELSLLNPYRRGG